MTKFHLAIFCLVLLIISPAFTICHKKIIYLKNIQVNVEDSTFKLEKVLLIKGQDSLIYDLSTDQEPIKIDMDASFKLLLISLEDTLEISDLNETFEENENFSLRITIPKKIDYCYYIVFFGNYGGNEYGL